MTRLVSAQSEHFGSQFDDGRSDGLASCPACGQFRPLKGRFFLKHVDENRYPCRGVGRYAPLPWPPPFPGMEVPDWLLTARGDFPPDGSD